jgi:hypothetical protein
VVHPGGRGDDETQEVVVSGEWERLVGGDVQAGDVLGAVVAVGNGGPIATKRLIAPTPLGAGVPSRSSVLRRHAHMYSATPRWSVMASSNTVSIDAVEVRVRVNSIIVEIIRHLFVDVE